ncbi:MAG: DEAD/DEAH box helicase family protein [Candidatus Zixiibacteriota bacterium]
MKDFVGQLSKGPSVLILGQDYLRAETSIDSLLEKIQRKYIGGGSTSLGYSLMIDTPMSKSPEDALAWIEGASLSIPIPAPLEVIAQFSWSGVFTSAIDSILHRAFRTEWRDLQVISDSTYRPISGRSRKRLNVWHLFGWTGAPDAAGRPPLVKEELWIRRNAATLMLNRLTEVASTVGTIAIEGYNPAIDWLSPELMFPIISQLRSGQVHLFSCTTSKITDERLKLLLYSGRLVAHEESLAQALHKAFSEGLLKPNEDQELGEIEHQIRIGGRPKTLDRELWTQISNTASIIPEVSFHVSPILDKETRYSAFRNFLFGSAFNPQWDAIALGFAFEREYEQHIFQFIHNELAVDNLSRRVGVLHGQTGTGKTVALTRVAYQLQREGRWPVLFIPRSIQRITRETLDKFCDWSENEGAETTIIIWDGMRDILEYRELRNSLTSRGKKVLLFGTSYSRLERSDKFFEFILAFPALGTSEFERFLKYIDSLDLDLVDLFRRKSFIGNSSFLVFLYRLLPATRTAIRSGIDKELAHDEKRMFQLASSTTIKSASQTYIADLLRAAGLAKDVQVLGETPSEIGGELLTQFQEILGLVMVPGQFNILCPFELLSRAVNKSAVGAFYEVLKESDFFDWSEDPSGNLLIGPRSALEAEIIVQQRIGGAAFEIDFAKRLILVANPSHLFGNQEVQFVIELIQQMGPNGKDPRRYQLFFVDLAGILETLRVNSGIIHPSLLLQESLMTREAAKQFEGDEQSQLLVKSIQASTLALDQVDSRPTSRPLRSRIRVELASAYGQLARLQERLADQLRYLSTAYEEAVLAYSSDPQNFHPIDVILWSVKDLFNSAEMSEEGRLQLIESAYHAFNLADAENYQKATTERLEERKVQLYQLFGNFQLSDQAFLNLTNSGSPRGVFLRASIQSSKVLSTNVLTFADQKVCEDSYKYLDSFGPLTHTDSRCLFLMLRLWWIWKTGKHLLVDEKVSPPFTELDWRECRNLVAEILETVELRDNLKSKYLLGVTLFTLRELSQAFTIFREIDNESLFYGNRLVKHLIWGNSAGEPLKFNGTVFHIDEKRKGQIYVPSLQARIPFLEQDSDRSGIMKGDTITEFKIGFSMRGPLAVFRE